MLSVYELRWYNISFFINTIYMKTLLNRSFIKQIKSFIMIAVASVFYGMGIALFLDPNNLASGGLSGISIIINRVTGIETGTMIFLLNIPIMIIGWWKFGGKFMLSTIFAIIMTSGFINYFSLFEKATDDQFLAAVTGGALVAVSIGIIFRAGATTGGTDIIVRLIKLKYKHMKTGGVFLILDMLVVAASLLVFKNIESALYAAVAVMVCSYTMDLVLYGLDEAKLFYVISRSGEKETEIVKELLLKLEVGATYLEAAGTYSGEQRRVILCAVRKQQLPAAKEIVRGIDDEAFMIVTSANEILGEGYKSHHGSGY